MGYCFSQSASMPSEAAVRPRLGLLLAGGSRGHTGPPQAPRGLQAGDFRAVLDQEGGGIQVVLQKR